MYAIIETGGKQYRVTRDEVLYVELLNLENSSIVEFTNVLLVNDGKQCKIGEPYVPSSCVKGEILDTVKAPKVVSFKYKQRKGVRRKVGHRQNYHKIKITEIIG
jgi:large subunit ribosomal protein L21